MNSKKFSLIFLIEDASAEKDPDCIWNSKFQHVVDDMKNLESNTPLNIKVAVYTKLADLAADFQHTAKTYAKIVSFLFIFSIVDFR